MWERSHAKPSRKKGTKGTSRKRLQIEVKEEERVQKEFGAKISEIHSRENLLLFPPSFLPSSLPPFLLLSHSLPVLLLYWHVRPESPRHVLRCLARERFQAGVKVIDEGTIVSFQEGDN